MPTRTKPKPGWRPRGHFDVPAARLDAIIDAMRRSPFIESLPLTEAARTAVIRAIAIFRVAEANADEPSATEIRAALVELKDRAARLADALRDLDQRSKSRLAMMADSAHRDPKDLSFIFIQRPFELGPPSGYDRLRAVGEAVALLPGWADAAIAASRPRRGRREMSNRLRLACELARIYTRATGQPFDRRSKGRSLLPRDFFHAVLAAAGVDTAEADSLMRQAIKALKKSNA